MKDKVALITGAGRGIGRVIALELARNGAVVVVNDLDEAGMNETGQKIKEIGRQFHAIPADVSSAASVEKMIEEIIEKFGKIDILVNNAGITRDALLLRMKEEDWDKVLNINLKSVFLCTKFASRYMMKQRYGKIVNISSVIGLVGNIGQANYSASKAGIIGFTKSSAKELAARGINVNAIAPGFIKTAMTEKLPENIKNEMLNRIPLGFLGEPEDVADLVLFLTSDKARYITGQVVNVDGGMVM